MIKRNLDAHIHFDMEFPMSETVGIFRVIFNTNKVDEGIFLPLPTRPGEKGEYIITNKNQNVNGLFLKYCFSPDFYAYAGLVHKDIYSSDESRGEDYLRQAKEYYENGYDGIKMLEGCSGNRKAMKRKLSDKVYDKFYAFLEEVGMPITLHVANPSKMWDINRVGKWNFEHDRFFDKSYPTKEEQFSEVIEIMNKFPKLNLTLAHFGFTTEDIREAEAFFSFENTKFDMTPGGEQYFYMLEKPEIWIPFLYKYQDRIKNGTDTYNVSPVAYGSSYERWEKMITNRPSLVKNFCDTDTEHEYDDDGITKYKGIKLEQSVVDKFFFENAKNELGAPKSVDKNYIIKKAKELLSDQTLSELQNGDIHYIIDTLQKGVPGKEIIEKQYAYIEKNMYKR